jgi:cytidine deaminase
MKQITDDDLIDAARAACKRAYAPYSNFRVGAAVASADSVVITGCNVENPSYGLTICAERAAVFAAVAAGITVLARIAIAVESGRIDEGNLMPCGACLQVLAEFMGADGEVLIAGNGKFKLGDLLPRPFTLPGRQRKARSV